MPEIDADEARQRFAEGRVARLATVDAEGRPHVVPTVFAVRKGEREGEDEIVTAVDRKPKRPGPAPLKRLRNIAVRPDVSLLVDDYDDEDWDRLWWVRADGSARIVPPDAQDSETRDEYAAAIALLRQKYAPYRRQPPDGPVILVAVRRWRGWEATRQGQ